MYSTLKQKAKYCTSLVARYWHLLILKSGKEVCERSLKMIAVHEINSIIFRQKQSCLTAYDEGNVLGCWFLCCCLTLLLWRDSILGKRTYLEHILDLHPHICHVVQFDIFLLRQWGHDGVLQVSQDHRVRSGYSIELVKQQLQQLQK